jgi:hypothetical protein
MIPNLNFYDVYGYLIPGLVLAVLFWLPHGLIGRLYPTADWSSALVAVVVGYVLGHIVQALARNAIPSATMGGRFPSEALLDKDNKNLSTDVKTRLRADIKRLAAIDVRTDVPRKKVTKEIRRQRRDGFYFCRDSLLTGKDTTYSEQIQGMYALTLGLTMGFLLAAPYHIGWALSGLARARIEAWAWAAAMVGGLVAVSIAVLGVLKLFRLLGLAKEKKTRMTRRVIRRLIAPSELARRRRARWGVGVIMLALSGLGYIMGLGKVWYWDQRGSMVVIAIAGLFASFTCLAAYRYFTVTYAETVYRAFGVYEKPEEKSRPANPYMFE